LLESGQNESTEILVVYIGMSVVLLLSTGVANLALEYINITVSALDVFDTYMYGILTTRCTTHWVTCCA
jgi:hypothetical protein